jgi:hypothetical protein
LVPEAVIVEVYQLSRSRVSGAAGRPFLAASFKWGVSFCLSE